MRSTTVFATVFSVCCCFSVLNLFSVDATEEKSNQFYEAKRGLLNIALTDEEVLRCQHFIENISELNQRLTEEELQKIVSQCSLLSQKKSKLFGIKDESGFIQSPPIENQRIQEQYFIPEEHSTVENSKQENVENLGTETEATLENLDVHEDLETMSATINPKPTASILGLRSILYRNEGSSGKSSSILVRAQNEGSSIEQPIDNPENQKKELDIVILNSTNTNWGLWSYFFGSKGSFDNSSSVLAKRNESNPNEKQTYEPENQETELNAANLSSTNTSWNLWNYFFGFRSSSNSSYETRPSENLEIGSVTESYIYFENSTDLEYLNEITVAWNIVMPGTKWCGSGNTAENDDDLGYFEDVDRCCRAHDKCNDLMLPGESKYNLTNTSRFTALHCKCDDELYDCLDKIDSVASNTVGNTFFNIFGRMCYILDHPKICKKSTLFGCIEYVIDETAKKMFQWKPARKYLKMPFTIPGR